MPIDALAVGVGQRVISTGLRKVFGAVMARTAQARMDEAIEAVQRELEAREISEEVVMQALSREQFVPLFDRLLREAADAATGDRRQMLAAAAAGMIAIDGPAELQSRIARAVVQLEPSDIIALQFRANGANAKRVPALPPSVQERYVRAAADAEISLRALIQAQCVSEVPGSAGGGQAVNRSPKPRAMVTEVGFEVLRYVLRPAAGGAVAPAPSETAG